MEEKTGGRASFFANVRPSEEQCGKLSEFSPTNPFYTYAYVAAQQQVGLEPWMLGIQRGDQIVVGCTAFLSRGRITAELIIPSHPAIEASIAEVFWSGVHRFCKEQGISRLQVNSYASPSRGIPAFAGEVSRTARVEYVISLVSGVDLQTTISSSHKRNAKKSRKSGAELIRHTDHEAAKQHVMLQSASMARRVSRGELLSFEPDLRGVSVLLESGCGELFQLEARGELLCSMLVLNAPAGAYYHSGGSSPAGMRSGASVLCVLEIAQCLKAQSKSVFNLGGISGENPGLRDFKSGFGSKEVHLEAADFFVGGFGRRLLSTALNMVR